LLIHFKNSREEEGTGIQWKSVEILSDRIVDRTRGNFFSIRRYRRSLIGSHSMSWEHITASFGHILEAQHENRESASDQDRWRIGFSCETKMATFQK
jgi:hypothetical protein